MRLVVEGCGSLLRVRTLEAAQSMQRACYTDVSRLCMVGSVLDLKRPHSMLSARLYPFPQGLKPWEYKPLIVSDLHF